MNAMRTATALCNARVLTPDGFVEGLAVLMQDGQQFDPDSFYALTEARLPRYAAPVFLRLSPEPDMTGNYKLRKVDLQREGYDTAQVQDPLFVRVESAGSYLPLSDATLREALVG